jgi:hypothetical protein
MPAVVMVLTAAVAASAGGAAAPSNLTPTPPHRMETVTAVRSTVLLLAVHRTPGTPLLLGSGTPSLTCLPSHWHS